MSQTETLDHHSHTATIPRTAGYPGSSGEARHLTRGYLATLSPQPTPETVDMALLVVSELVTNALQHASGVTGFGLSASRHVLHVTVCDGSPVLPHERTPDLAGAPAETGGFGWPLVRHFANDVAIRVGPGNAKSICAALPL